MAVILELFLVGRGMIFLVVVADDALDPEGLMVDADEAAELEVHATSTSPETDVPEVDASEVEQADDMPEDAVCGVA